MARRTRHCGFSLLELVVSLAIIAVLLAVLVPTLTAARVASHREQCAANQRTLGQAWLTLLDQKKAFPAIYDQPAWNYGGVRFSAIESRPFFDRARPLNEYVRLTQTEGGSEHVFCCPGDNGINDESTSAAGTGRRSAFESFGTSYRANAKLLDARLAGFADEQRGLRLDEISTAPDSTVIMGDAVWFEAIHGTGRVADWHRTAHAGNLLFLDGSVKFMTIDPDSRRIESMFDPRPRSGSNGAPVAN